MFEPTPLLTRDSSHGLDYWWVQTATLDLECVVSNIAWNHEGTRYFHNSNSSFMIHCVQTVNCWRHSPTLEVRGLSQVQHRRQLRIILRQVNTRFSLVDTIQYSLLIGCCSWQCVWRVRPASPVVYLAFSADGTLFATAGKHDR